MRNFKSLCFLAGITFLIALTSVQLVFACSPAENLHIYCDDEKLNFAIFREEDLPAALNSCALLQSVAGTLSTTLLEANALDSLIIISTKSSQNDQKQMMQTELRMSDCYSPVFKEGDGWILGYSERHPYCVREFALFCGSYVVSPGRKIAFELGNNQLLNPFALLTTSVTSIFAGVWLARKIFSSPNLRKIHTLSLLTKRRIVFLSIVVILFFLCIVPGTLFLAPSLLNRLFFPSIIEYIARMAMLLFLLSFVLAQNWLHFKSSKALQDVI